jgi:hypothetical protein
MTTHTHQTAPTQLVEANGIRFAYRRFGKAGGVALVFTPSESSQAAGHAYLKRFRERREGRDPEVNEKVAPAQVEALARWGAPRANPFDYLKAIHQPTLVINGFARSEDGRCHPVAGQSHEQRRGKSEVHR